MIATAPVERKLDGENCQFSMGILRTSVLLITSLIQFTARRHGSEYVGLFSPQLSASCLSRSTPAIVLDMLLVGHVGNV